jgi:hypothetical protein
MDQNAWFKMHGPKRIVQKAWFRAHGQNAWSKAHGPKRMVQSACPKRMSKTHVQSAWSKAHGPKRIVQNAWSKTHGPKCMVQNAWSKIKVFNLIFTFHTRDGKTKYSEQNGRPTNSTGLQTAATYTVMFVILMEANEHVISERIL